MQFLESRLIALARAAKRMPLDNANQPAEPSLSEADRADMQVFLDNMLGMLPVLGVSAFELPSRLQKPERLSLVIPSQTPAPMIAMPNRLRTCRGKGVEAIGFESSQGFVVQAGSQTVIATTPSIQSLANSIQVRQDLIANGVLVREGDVYRFSPDFIFSSPSAASDLVMGSVTNGRTSWKDASGRTLKELQAAEASVRRSRRSEMYRS